MCNHTWVPICGFDKTSTKIRSFPDECDMIEYNCDFKTDYIQTDHDKCRNNNIDDANEASDVITTLVSSGRKSNVKSVLNDPDYATSTYPYRLNEDDQDDDSYLEDVSRNKNRLRSRDDNMKAGLSSENFPFLTTVPVNGIYETNIISNNTVTAIILPSLTIADAELTESKTVTSTDSLRHGQQCTCGQHTNTEMMTNATESTTVSLVTECTRHKITTASPSKSTNTVQTTTAEPVTTTDHIINETTIEHASHSIKTDGKCNCGKYSAPVPSDTTAYPTMTGESITTTNPLSETEGDCTCYKNTTPVMTSSSNTSEDTTTSSTTTPVISTTSTTSTTTPTDIETETSEATTKTYSTPVNETGGQCTCFLYTTPVMSPSTITTKETTTPTPTTTVTFIDTTIISSDRECTCNMQTNEVTIAFPTTEMSTLITTSLTSTPVATTTTITSLITTSIKSTTTPTINFRECTCGQTFTGTTTTTEPTTITELPTTTTELTTTVEPKTTTEPTTKTAELSTTEQVTEPFRCTCNMDTTTVTTPSITTAESTTKKTTTEDTTKNEIDSTSTETTTETSKQHVTCSAYPAECKIPSTWETTSKGETRDFFRILKERYGNRVKILRATTHWPLRNPKIKRFRDSFRYGRHNEG